MIGQTVGNYRIVRELGTGGMGAVYEGVDQMLERPVAIKMLRADIARQPEIIERFRVEAITLAKLGHPSIATLYSFFREGEDYFMVMEFVRGRTLESLLAASGRLPPARAAEILRQTLDALSHAHSLGVLHRDVKPANIMLNENGVVKVTDFGIARILGSSRMTREGRLIGTLEYIAPERIRGDEGDVRSDLYSAGVVLYEMLAGRLPFVSDTDYGLIEAHLKHQPPPLASLNPNCPPELEAVLLRALAKAPDARFRTAEEFKQAILKIAPTMKPTRLAEPLSMPETRLAEVPGAVTVSPKLPLRWIAGGGVALGLLLVTASFLVMSRHQKTPAPPVTVTASVPSSTVGAGEQSGGALVGVQIPGGLPPEVRDAVAGTGAPQGSVAVGGLSEALGNAKASDGGAAKPTGPRTIRGVRRLYVQPMGNHLDQYIREEIRDELSGRIYLVASPDDADGIMSGAAEHRTPGSKFNPGRVVKNAEVVGRITINSSSGRLLWASEADDKTLIVGISKHGGPKKVAERLVSKLKKAL